jgi:hypothetical protein
MLKFLTARPGAYPRAYRALRFVLLGLIALLVVFGLVAGLWLPGYVKTRAQDTLTNHLGRPVTIGALSISPYTLSVTVRDFRVGEADQQGHTLAIGSVYLNVSSASLFALAPVIQEIHIEQPQISLRRFADGRLSIADVIERVVAKAAEKNRSEEKAPFQFAVHNISLTQGLIQFDDQPNKRQHEITALEIGIPFISNFPSREDVWVEPRISAMVNDAPFGLEGKASIFGDSKKITLNVDLENLSLAGIEAYFDAMPGLKINKAAFSSALEISFVQEPQKTPEIIVSGSAAVRGIDLGIQSSQNPLQFNTQNLNLEMEALDLRLPQPLEKSRIGKVTISAPAGRIRARDASLSLSAPFEVSEPLVIAEDIAFSGQSPAMFQINGNVNRKGRIEVSGDLSGWQNAPDPLRANVKVKARDVEIVAFQHFAQKQLGKALLTKGAVSMDAEIRMRGAQATLEGDAQLRNVNLLERETNAEILGWRSLEARGIYLVSDPFQLELRSLVVDRPVTRLVLRENGELNFAAFVAPNTKEPVAKTAAAGSSAPQKPQDLPVTIRSLTLQHADIFFLDRFTKPNFQTSLTEISGTVAPLKAGSPGTIDLQGKVNNSAPLFIAGAVDPFSSQLFLDMRLSVQGADMPPVSPYSVRYLAYPIERGKLSLDLSYKIKDRSLDSQNRIKLDQLTLGPKMESPDSLSIPLALVVALLKNSKGEIDINLPVAGSLDAPQFSVAGLVFKAFVNLLVKVVTSPFALLGSLFGDGTDLSRVDFLPGSAELTAETEKTLDRLAKALLDRPGLRLDMTATVNLAQEKQAMLRAKLLEQIKASRLAEIAKTGKSAGTIAEISLTEAQYKVQLTALYQAAPFQKPKNLVGMVKPQPIEEMEARLLESMTLTESDSLALANQRSQLVRERLASRGVPASQLFVLAPGIDASGASKKPGHILFSLSQ